MISWHFWLLHFQYFWSILWSLLSSQNVPSWRQGNSLCHLIFSLFTKTANKGHWANAHLGLIFLISQSLWHMVLFVAAHSSFASHKTLTCTVWFSVLLQSSYFAVVGRFESSIDVISGSSLALADLTPSGSTHCSEVLWVLWLFHERSSQGFDHLL